MQSFDAFFDFIFNNLLNRHDAMMLMWYNCNIQSNYRWTSNINHTLVGNKIVDHSDVVGASPVGAAPTTS